jgi:3-oxoacyl-[acyl-carrier-protein] synthase-3
VANNSAHFTRIDAIYSCVPSEIAYTKDHPSFDVEAAGWFEKSTGIHSRRIAPKEVTCSDLCLHAAEKLLGDFEVLDAIDLLIFVSQSPDHFLPATSIILQEKLGISSHCLAFDVNLGCSGYVYGLNIISQFMEKGQFKKALLLAGDKSTISTHPEDKSTSPLFGDAGTATLISYDKTAGPWFFNSGSDGKGKDSIIIPGGHSRHPYGTFDEKDDAFDGGVRSLKHLHMDGLSVFNFALKHVPSTIAAVLSFANETAESVDYFVLHQANGLITNTIAKKLKVPHAKFLTSIENFGNTSSASIPLTICVNDDVLWDNSPKKWLFCGFGVGFSWATLCFESNVFKTKLLTYERN